MLLALLLGCRPPLVEDTAPPAPVALVDPAAWVALPLTDDPLPDHQPLGASCDDASWYLEYSGLEIDTTACSYLALTQPLPFALAAGEPLSLLAWHQTLVSEAPAVGHMAVLIDGVIAWEITVDIPAGAGVYESEVRAPVDASAGAPVVLHLHNHGYNTWQFDTLEAFR